MARNTKKKKTANNQAAIQAQAKFQQAHSFLQRDQLAQAKVFLEATLKIQPNHYNALHLLSVIAAKANDLEIAIGLMDKAIAINPDVAAVHYNRGLALQELKKFHEASKSYAKAFTLKPDYEEAYYNCGIVLGELQEFDVALLCYDKLISLKPDCAEAHNNRGSVLKEIKQYDAALASFDRAITLKPDYELAHYNRGATLVDIRQFDTALASYDKTISLKPDFAEAYNNRGNVLKAIKQFDAALKNYNKAISLKPDYAEAHWNKSLQLLLSGEFEDGLKEYEWRWKWDKFSSPKRNFTQPQWDGDQSIAGKTVLLHSEQGLGDAIQFVRYAKMVSDLGARVILEVNKPLASLFTNLDGVSQVVTGNPLPPFDLHCPLLSLPLAFKTNINTIPASVPYLSGNSENITRLKTRLGDKRNLRIGLVWSGSMNHKNDQNRSLLLSTLLQHFPRKYQYVSLQKEIRDEDIKTLQSRPDILQFNDELNDFSDTAALCMLMDVIISVDTSVAHLAGALGKHVWILLPYIPDWRWLLDRNDSPWYPTAKLYRQEKIGDWAGVLEIIKSDLMKLRNA